MLMADLIFFSLCTFQLHFRMMVRKLMMRMLRRRYQIEMWAVDVGTPQARWQEKPIAKPAKVWQAPLSTFNTFSTWCYLSFRSGTVFIYTLRFFISISVKACLASAWTIQVSSPAYYERCNTTVHCHRTTYYAMMTSHSSMLILQV